jgi:hypothetical protein
MENNPEEDAGAHRSGRDPLRTVADARTRRPLRLSTHGLVKTFLLSFLNETSTLGRRSSTGSHFHVHIILAGRDLNRPIQVAHLVLRPRARRRHNRDALYLHLKTLRRSHRNAAVVQLERVAIKLGDRLWRKHNLRAVEIQGRRKSRLGFEQISGKNGG